MIAYISGEDGGRHSDGLARGLRAAAGDSPVVLVAPQHSLTHEQGTVLSVTRRPNAWYEARIATASGVTLTCRARRNPLAWASRCPIPALETIIGARVTIQHNGTTLYVIEHAGTTLLGFDEFRAAQATAVGIAALLLTMAGVALWRAS